MVDKNIFSKSQVSVKVFAILKGNKKLITPKPSAHSKTCRVQREGSLCSWLRVILLVACWVHGHCSETGAICYPCHYRPYWTLSWNLEQHRNLGRTFFFWEQYHTATIMSAICLAETWGSELLWQVFDSFMIFRNLCSQSGERPSSGLRNWVLSLCLIYQGWRESSAPQMFLFIILCEKIPI